jgi:Fic family protein
MPFDPAQPFNLPLLRADCVPMAQWETPAILKACIEARAALSALHQATALLPNPDVMLSSLVLLESQASSEIENIVTTTDALFEYAQADARRVDAADSAVKETLRYRESLYYGMAELKTRPLTTTLMEEICTRTKGVDMRVRNVPGTALTNARTRQTIYTPPQGESHLRELLADWERFCHALPDDAQRGGELDPLVRMAALHYQFEAIHPFLDGNGRTGRVLNLLFLVEKGLLSTPILYLSRHILHHRSDYYAKLLAVSREGSNAAWRDWIAFMLDAVRETAKWTLAKVLAISTLIAETHAEVQRNTKLGNQKGLIELAFRLPYCRIADVVEEQIAKRQTAAVYLQTLAEIGVLNEVSKGREKLYLNHRLIELLKGEVA